MDIGVTQQETIPFSRPTLTGEERDYINKVFETGKFSGKGNFSKASREWFRDNYGTDLVLMTPSCTHALEIAAMLTEVGPGDEVILPSFTFTSTATAFVRCGASLVFVDIRPDTMNIDPEQIERAITDRTKVIVTMDYAGVACDYDRINEIAREHGLLVVEDSAQALLCSYNGKWCGTLADLGCFSFHETKNLQCGEGGALIASTQELFVRAEIIQEKGTDRSRFLRGEVDKYTWQDAGSSYELSEINGAILRCQLERLPDQHRRRAANVARFEAGLAEVPGFAPMPRDPRVTERTAYQVLVRYDGDALGGVPRDHVILALRAEGVPCSGRFYVPLNRDPLFAMDPHTNPAARAGIDYASQRFPEAERAAFEQSIWLPHELFLGDAADADDLVAAFARIAAQAEAVRARPPEGPVSRR